MITGVEVAGLSLAILPLIVSALEHYNDGTRPLKDFVKYRCLIRIMVIDLGTQSELLRNSIEKLLDGLVSDTEIATLLENPAGPAWRERSLATRLEKRLAGAYMVYMESIKNILILLEDLRDKIGLDENGQHRWIDMKMRKKVWKRFMFCLSRKEHETILSKIDSSNRNLKTLTSSSRDLEKLRSKRRSSKEAFKRTTDSARLLHRLLNLVWSCSCQSPHRANLYLESREPDAPPVFKVAFPVVSGVLPEKWHETEIHLLVSCSAKLDEQDSIRTHSAHDHALAHLDAEDVRLNNFSETAAQKSSVPEGSISSGQAVDVSARPSHKKKAVSWAKTVQSRREKDTGKEKKATQTDISLEQPVLRADQSSTITYPKILNLCSALQQYNDQQNCLGYLMDEQLLGERFVVSQPLLKSLSHVTSLEEMLMYQRTLGSPTISSSLTDAQIAAQTGNRLTKKQRLRLAVTLASTTLQLHATPWLDQEWGRKDILFCDSLVEQPHISQLFSKVSEPSPEQLNNVKWSPIRNLSVFGLGVMLLELSFGRPLDEFRTAQDPPAFADFVVAQRLLERLEDEESSTYTDVVRACIHCDFGSKIKVSSLEDEVFRQAVYEEVVRPLEDEWAYWTGKAR